MVQYNMRWRRSGDFNLKGKKTKILGCSCCLVINEKDKILKKIIEKEMKDDLN